MPVICDFCSGVPVVARYHADDIISVTAVNDVTFTQESVGDWAACQHCSALVDAGFWDMLLDRAVEQFYINNPGMEGSLPRVVVFSYLANLYATLRTADFKKVPL